MDPGAKRTRVLFFQHFSRVKRSGVRIGYFQSKLKTRRLETRLGRRSEARSAYMPLGQRDYKNLEILSTRSDLEACCTRWSAPASSSWRSIPGSLRRLRLRWT